MAKKSESTWLENQLTGHVWHITDPSVRAYMLKQTQDEADAEDEPLFKVVDPPSGAEAQPESAEEQSKQQSRAGRGR